MKRILSLLLALTIVVLMPTQAMAASKKPGVYSVAAVVMDAKTGEVLYSRKGNTPMYPASLTKIMTCLVAVKYGDPNDTVRVTQESLNLMSQATRLGLVAGEQIPMSDLLYALMLPSANDAANAIAIHISGSTSKFVKLMNAEAKALGCKNTKFRNPHGLPDDRHYTTAKDLALITQEALKYSDFTKYAGKVSHTISATNKSKARTIKHLNGTLDKSNSYYIKGTIAGKTGWTVAAGNCLMTTCKRNGRTLICIVLNASGTANARYVDTANLLAYGFSQSSEQPAEKLDFDAIRRG